MNTYGLSALHDDVIRWKHFPRYWPFVWGIHWSPVNSPHKGQWRGALVFSLVCAWINSGVNNRADGDVGCHRTHYDVTVLWWRTGVSAPDVQNMEAQLPPNLWYKTTKSQLLNVSRLVLQFSLPNPLESVVKSSNEDVIGAALTGDAPTTSEFIAY